MLIPRYTCSFKEVSASSAGRVGGKAANLGELVAQGFPVPEGFCVTADAYARFIEAHGLTARIPGTLEGLNHEDSGEVGRLAASIRGWITGAEIPEEITREILEAYRELRSRLGEDLRVAVRSSATAEDLPGASFAGQQETYLNVRGEGPLLDSVKKCWGSLWTARAVCYRQMRGFSHAEVQLAVVVQEMFPSEISGVMFTANPVTSNATEIIVNSSWGLGEAVVAGLVTPDQYVLDKRTLEIKDRQINEKIVMIVAGDGGDGTRRLEVSGSQRNTSSLSDDALSELAQLGRRIENHYRYPQDIEWGYARGRFSILQSREVTGADIDFGEELETWNRRNPDLDDRIAWTRAWADQFQTGPQTPLMYSVHQEYVTRVFDEMYRLYGMRKFLQLRVFRWYKTRFYYSTEYEKARVQLWPRFARSEEVVRFFPPSEWEAIRKLPFRWWRRMWMYVRLSWVAPKYSLRRCIDTFYREMPEQQEKFRRAMEIDVEAAPFEVILNAFRTVEKQLFDHSLTICIALLDHAYLLILVLAAMLRRWCGDDKGLLYGALVSGLPRNKTGQENIDVWKLSRQVRASAVLRSLFEGSTAPEILEKLETSLEGKRFRATLDEFLKEYGHRGGSERELSYPRWRHKPELLVNAIKALVSGYDSLDPELTEAKLAERRESVTRECLEKVRRRRWGLVKAPLFRFFLEWTQKYLHMRDNERFYADHYMTARHDLFLALGKRLVERGLVGDQTDVFFLAFQEIVAAWEGRLPAKDVRVRVQARRRVHQKYSAQPPPKFLRGSQAFDSDVEEAAEANVLRGVAASGGRLTARARVCRVLEETGKVEKGDILVACATDPGWTPVFSVLGGVVIETGGILAHATLVSREYGIPCVTNVNRATELIRDGQDITIDGDTGKVILEVMSSAPSEIAVEAEAVEA